MNIETARTVFYSRLEEIALLTSSQAVLDWDMQVTMPKESGAYRAKQLELMAKLVHERMTSPELVEAIRFLVSEEKNLSELDRINVLEMSRRTERGLKLSAEHVAEKMLVATKCFDIWCKAKPEADFAAVMPLLTRVIELQRKETELVGYSAHPYDALLDVYEPKLTLAVVKPLLLEVGEELRKIIPALHEGFKKRKVIAGTFDIPVQQELSKALSLELGLPAGKTRVDIAPHPFMTSLGPRDMRITTRYKEDEPFGAIYGTIHECGHALYELQLPEEHFGTPRGGAVSLGIHESQSRFLENIVGRSRPFASYLGRLMDRHFPKRGLADADLIWNSVNQVEPSFVRVEADEVTYTLHIIIRMLMEEEIIAGTLPMSKMEARWNSLYEHYLGITPPTPREGVMQDVHWFWGSFGYFPTYALGNLYGAHFLEALERDQPKVWEEVEAGRFTEIVRWLGDNIHSKGGMYSALELVERVGGEKLNGLKFVGYIQRKFKDML